MSKPTLLILSFPEISRDARVLKQVGLFKDRYRVVTCSRGPAPEGVDEHIRIPDSESFTYMDGRLITLKMYRAVYWQTPAVAWVRKALAGKHFDVVLADDYDTVPLALSLKPKHGVHADLHEYSPRQMEHDSAWRRRIKPYREWVIRKYVPHAKSWTTVCQGLSDEYEKEFGFRSKIVTNAAPYADLAPQPVSDPIRLVHHGGVGVARGIDWMVKAVMQSSADFVFDLYLKEVSGSQIPALREIVENDPRINVYDAVPYDQLIPMLNTYDVGLSTILPNTFNLLHALPNKLFEYVQARAGIITGPSPEMARIVRDYDLGIVIPDFSSEELTAAIDGLNPDDITQWKLNADKVAFDLSSERQNIGWEQPIEAMLGQ